MERGGTVRPIDRTIVFLLLGLGAGAVYAGLGLGLVLVHRVSGVVHVAHGAVAAYVAYVFVELRTVGDLVLPVGRVHLGDDHLRAHFLLIPDEASLQVILQEMRLLA